MINKENIYNQIKKSGNLPTLPEILLKLLEACDNDATPLSEIASIISKDPALSLRVLQLVNSSSYGLRSTFTGISQAVVCLGANSIKNIAVTASVNQVFERKQFKAVKQFNIRTFWWQSLMCATFARRIAKKVEFDSIEEAYLSGLLHDIGKLVLVSTFPNEYNWFLLDTEVVQNELWAEAELIGITHCEAGSWLVRDWKLNSLMADAIRYHHESLELIKEAFPLVKIVYLSNMLRETSYDDVRNCEAGNLLLGLDGNNLKDIADGAIEEMQQIAENLNINIMEPSAREKSLQKEVQQAVINKESVSGGTSDGMLQPNNPGHTGGEAALTERIKNITLLSGILENLVQAGNSAAIIAVFEQSMSILFDFDKVLFFLPDKDNRLLKGRTSPSSSLQHLAQGLILPVKQSSSLMVKAFLETSLIYLTRGNGQGNLADKQVLAAFRCATVVIVPIITDKKPLGVILLGLPESVKTLSKNDSKLIHVIVRQVGLCLFLEKMKVKRAEEIEAERMAAVSMAARKLAHEINNPLGIITNCLTTMTLKLIKENEIQEEMRLIGEEINRISSMINQMDKFSQAAFTSFELTDVNAVIEDIIHIVKSSLFVASETIINFRPDVMLPQIVTSRDAIKQVMINLLKNASEAMDNGGIIDVRTRMFSNFAQDDQLPKADGIEIIVADTGPGLPESVVKNLYKPIVTTKKDGHYGLGLSIAHKAIKDLGGSIAYANTPADGASFTIFLPLEKKDFI